MNSLAILDREVYSEASAARLLRVPPSTLHYWLEGEGGRGKKHPPVIRPARKGRGAGVTWAEFIEAGLLREYRSEQVSMSTLRAFIEKLREEFGVPYPLADRTPWIDQGRGRQLLYDAQVETGLDARFALVAAANDQLVLTAPSQSFLDRVEWNGDHPEAYRPHDDPASNVRCLPETRFGKPSVQGISTEALWEQHQAGLDNDEIAETYGLPEDDVLYAIAYERSLARKAV